jgi:hypothetical protein
MCVYLFLERNELVGLKTKNRVVFGSNAGDSDIVWYRWLPRLSEFLFWDYIKDKVFILCSGKASYACGIQH